MRVERGAGGEESLNAAAELLATAKFPVILAGGGVVMGDAVQECRLLAERLGAPVVNGYLRNDSFPASNSAAAFRLSSPPAPRSTRIGFGISHVTSP